MIYFLLVCSTILNVFLALYLRSLLLKHSDLVSLIEDIQYKIKFFTEHLESIYGLEVFYGEPVIQNLIEHSKTLLSSFNDFNEEYDLLLEEESSDEQISQNI